MKFPNLVITSGVVGAVLLSSCTDINESHKPLGLEHYSPAVKAAFNANTAQPSSRSVDSVHQIMMNMFLASTSDDPSHFSNTIRRTDDLIDGLNMTITVDHEPATGVMSVVPAPEIITLPLPGNHATTVTHLAKDLSAGITNSYTYGYSLNGDVQEVISFLQESNGTHGVFYGRKSGDTSAIVTATIKESAGVRCYHEITLVGASRFSITSNGEVYGSQTSRRVIGNPKGHFLVMDEFNHVFLYNYSEGTPSFSVIESKSFSDFTASPFEAPDGVDQGEWNTWVAYVTTPIDTPLYPTDKDVFNDNFINKHFPK